jgi:hypothetical protein
MVKRADPSSLTEADYLRAVKNVERTKKLFEKGKTPGELINDLIELISCARDS